MREGRDVGRVMEGRKKGGSGRWREMERVEVEGMGNQKRWKIMKESRKNGIGKEEETVIVESEGNWK